jgi:hypothetical protein
MTSKPVAQLLVDLGVARSHSRPRVSNDNPCSEAQFKTLKYCPAFPGRFGSIADARVFCDAFFDHYNHVHRHTGIGLHTPARVHYGTAIEVRAQRAITLVNRVRRTHLAPQARLGLASRSPTRPRRRPHHMRSRRARPQHRQTHRAPTMSSTYVTSLATTTANAPARFRPAFNADPPTHEYHAAAPKSG